MTRPGTAAVLSLIIPGVGQIYNGKFLRGIFWLIITPGLWIGSGGTLGWICHLISAYTAYRFASRVLVYRFIKVFTDQVVRRSNFFQRCTTGAAFISLIPSRILSRSSALDFTRICLKNVCAILPNRVSTKLSQEPCLGVCT